MCCLRRYSCCSIMAFVLSLLNLFICKKFSPWALCIYVSIRDVMLVILNSVCISFYHNPSILNELSSCLQINGFFLLRVKVFAWVLMLVIKRKSYNFPGFVFNLLILRYSQRFWLLWWCSNNNLWCWGYCWRKGIIYYH